MGTKYTTIAASGFNSSPPPDDGSQSASNLITWSGIKTKLADPLHTEIDAINTALMAALNTSVRQITVADSSVAGDHWRTVEIAPTVSNTITLSLGDAATMTTTYLVAVRNSSTISQIISRATAGDKIDGVAGNITIPSKSTILFTTNSVPDGYLSLSRFGPVIDTDPIVVGGTDGTKKVRLEVDGLTTGTTRVVTVPDRDITLGDLSGITNSLSGDVALNNVANYIDGPSVAQGTAGTWFASGIITCTDTAGPADLYFKLWDGTTTIASGHLIVVGGLQTPSVSVSGYIANPAGNIRISVKDITSTNGLIKFNVTGTSKDSTLSAIRIA